MATATGAESGILQHTTVANGRVHSLWNFLSELESSLDALPEAFVLFDKADRLILANEQYYRIYPSAGAMAHRGVPFEEIATRSVRTGEFVINEDPQDWLRRRIDFHRNGVGFFEQHLDTGKWIRVSERRTRSGGVVSVRADITQLKARERSLRRSVRQAEFMSRSMARFLAIFGHEVRNGLNGVLGIAQMLALDAVSPAQQRQGTLLLDSCNRLSAVMTDLLDYLKNEANGVTITPTDMDPVQPVLQVHAEFSQRARERGLRLEYDMPAQAMPRMRIDGARVVQVLVNLVSNAVKYSDSGTVRISVQRKAGSLQYTVSDEGSGIPASLLGNIFEFFASASPDNAESTGLGLAISRQLVGAMGGAIHARNNPGRGARFWFDIPADSAPSAGAEDGTGYTAPAAALRVGVLDDDPLNMYVAEDFLHRLGHIPRILSSGDDACDAVVADRLDVVLLDLEMPEESGYDVACRLRARRGKCHDDLRIIAVTANVSGNTRTRCEHAGMDGVIEKPLRLAELGRVLRTSLRRPAQNAFAQADPAPPPAQAVPAAGAEDAEGHAGPAAVLEGLRKDIGERRFADACGSARDLLHKLIAGMPEGTSYPSPGLLHRVQGNAAQLGFLALREAASSLEVLVEAQQGLATGITGDYSLEAARANLAQCAREAILILDRFLPPPRKKVRPRARPGSRSRAP
ncbi:ATP-binding protein [Bordetella genomosp. 10]|uniref:ATP-binding protein n=1 Tax=Bordetella genomosp. 10 TaxID=1416804 RepID=UPI0015C59A09|nr:ATP-binding protein [Bordetella genomosp. 10]